MMKSSHLEIDWDAMSFEERLDFLTDATQPINGWIQLMKYEYGHTDSGLALLTQKEAAKLLHVSEPVFRKMVSTDPRLPRYKVGSGLRFNKAALLTYMIDASKDWTSHMDMLEGMTL